MSENLTAERLREVLSYEPTSGHFTRVATGEKAGWTRPGSYTLIRVDGYQYLAHRLAFLFMMGRWPYEEIDHRDCNKSNNRWENLREASRAQNNQNRRGLGVGRCKNNRWRAYIGVSRSYRHIGYFDTKEAALAAYAAVAKKEFGEFARVAQ